MFNILLTTPHYTVDSTLAAANVNVSFSLWQDRLIHSTESWKSIFRAFKVEG